ncbi:hypothetical protein UlMin_040101 [Ulmus minor]
MSENHDSVDGSEVVGEVDQSVSFSEPSSDPTGSPEAANGSFHGESPPDGIEDHVGESVNQDNGELVEADEPKLMEDSSKEDMFVDAPDELVTSADGKEAVPVVDMDENSEEKLNLHEENGVLDDDLAVELERFRAMLDKTIHEKERAEHEYKREREDFAREVVKLRQELKALTKRRPLPGESDGELVHPLDEDETLEVDTSTPLSELMNECSRIVKSAYEERLQIDATIREFHAALLVKDREIESLNAKVTEFPVSHVETVTNNLLSSLASVVDQQEVLDNSISGKLAYVEHGTSVLIWKYNMILYEISQFRQCFSDAGLDVGSHEEFGTFFAAVRDELFELKRKEVDFAEKLSHLEDENRKLIRQLDDQNMLLEKVNAELEKTKTELEQEKTRSSNTKEKLTMAVTKGKALVQQRDSLKHIIAEKTSELEKCLAELQEKSSALEASEFSKEELVRSESLVASLQETLTQRNAVLGQFEEIFSQTDLPEELLPMDIVEKCRWLVDKNNELKGVSLEFNKVKDALSLINPPEIVSYSELDSQVHWLRESFTQAKAELSMLQTEVTMTREAAQEEIDRLTASLSAELQTKDYLQMELDDLTHKYNEVVEKEHQVSMEKGDIVQAKDFLQMELDDLTRKYNEIVEKEHQVSKEKGDIVQTKDYLQMELDELTCKYNEIVEKEHQVSLEKGEIVKMLLEASGTTMDDGVHQTSSDIATLIGRCIENMKDHSNASSGSYVDVELFEELQSHLYVKNLELMLCELVLEEEMLVKLELDNVSTELNVVSQELVALKEEKESLQKDLGRSEEKSALLREKLSMAVKKGKGLVQDRENLKHQLDEKNSEIEKLRLQLQQQESALADSRGQISSLSADVESIPKLETDLAVTKEQRDQLEKFLLESNSMLQRLIESIDGIVLPVDSVFEEPAEKLNWLARYVNESQDSKKQAKEELVRVKEEASNLAGNLAEAQETIRSLEDALSVAENNISQLDEEKREAEVDKKNVEQALQKALEQASFHTGKFAEFSESKKSLEEALSFAENNLSAIISEKESALTSRGAAETELEQVKEEVATQTSKLTEAYKTIKSLEDALSQVEANVTLLTEQNNDVQVERTKLESELKKLQEEAESHASKLAHASATIKSLEDALLKAENNVSVLEGEKQELAGTNGSLESRSTELTDPINDLLVLMKDESLLHIMKGFEKNLDSLKAMDVILKKNIRDHFAGLGLEQLQGRHTIEEDAHVRESFADGLDNNFDPKNYNGDVNVAEGDHFRKTVEGFKLRDKFLVEKFGHFSSSIEEFIAALLRKLEETSDDASVVLEHIQSLKQKVDSLEMHKQEQDSTIAVLENDVYTLLSACTNATRELQVEVKNHLVEVNSLPELEQLRNSFSGIGEIGGDRTEDGELDDSIYGKEAETLLLAARKVQALSKQFESTSDVAASIIVDLQNNLKEARTSSQKAIEEGNLKQNRVSKLEADLQALQNSCHEMRLAIEDYEAKEIKLKESEEANEVKLREREEAYEVKLKEREEANEVELKDREEANEIRLKEREAELSSLYNSLLMKEKEAESSFLSSSQVKTLFEKIKMIGSTVAVFEEDGDLKPHDSIHAKKLFYIVDNFVDLQHQKNLLSDEKEELQSTLETQKVEIQHLKEEVGKHFTDEQDLEKMKNELSDLISGIEKIIGMLGDDSLVEDKNSSSVRERLSVLEKQVMALLLESESSKSKSQELSAKLVGSQNVVDELSSKIKLLEDSLQGRAAQSEIFQERSIFEAPSIPTGPEISEIEDGGSVGKKTISPVPPAAHVRTMRKGSTDHLALDIDAESSRLISSEETDEDKGHVFKSLNTSGLIPKQGKLVADRVDGIWVSGGRVLMSRPRARLGLIAYCILLHIWVLGTIL